ncbi:hypothetical protein I7I48_03992 [Histoplasma ohiense]|nr:hypothetical protein I7I48_03992 [Histoplasma ohiense (nom. inval.)]
MNLTLSFSFTMTITYFPEPQKSYIYQELSAPNCLGCQASCYSEIHFPFSPHSFFLPLGPHCYNSAASSALVPDPVTLLLPGPLPPPCPFDSCFSPSVSPFRIASTLSTITASMPSLTCNFTFFGSLFAIPYETQTRPDSFTTLTSRGAIINGSAAVTTPSKFHREANRMASCRLLARTSPTLVMPESVRNITGIEGCLKESKRQMSGLKEEKIMLRPCPRS